MENWLQQFAEHRERLPGAQQPQIRALREESIQRVADAGLPTLRDEDWRYTSLQPLGRREFKLSEAVSPSLEAADLEAFRFPELDTWQMVFVDGQFMPGLSKIEDLPDGVIVHDLASWLVDENREALMLRNEANVLASLNTAFMVDGAVIRTRENVIVEKPLHLIFITTAREGSFMVVPRIDLRTGANSEIRVVENFVAMGAAQSLTNTLTNIVAGENSRIEYYHLQEESKEAWHLANIFVDQKQDSRVIGHSVSLGAALARVDFHINLDAAGGENILNGLYMGKDRQHTDHHILIEHLSPHTRSEQRFKGIMDGASRGVFNGKVVVHEGAQKIEAVQSNRNLLLSDQAEVDTKPELEIYADDVKCAHGATVGQLNEDELFYLRSRGIGEEKARALLTWAFADDVISRMALDPIRQTLEKKLAGEFSRTEQFDDIRDLV